MIDPIEADAGDVSTALATACCRNCGAKLLGSYCHECGQHGPRSGRLRCGDLLRDVVERILSLESSFLRTILGLTLRPGIVSAEYVDGKRKRYTNPLGYFLLAAAVNLFLAESAGSELVSAEEELPEFVVRYFTQISLLGFLPLALVWCLLFRRAQRNLAENYAFALYAFGHLIWLETVLLVPLSLLVPEGIMNLAYAVLVLGYLVLAGTGFYRENPFMVAGKYLLSMVLVCAAAFLAAALIRLLLIPFWPIAELVA